LCTTSKTINEIAEECGFSSLSYFFQRFRQHFKISPRKYRLEQLRTVPRN
jgi:AraC-like DNA-binding protein